jgi:predicted phosphodiesterase
MRKLIILRGPALSGRSEFARDEGLSPWHIDQKTFEMAFCDPVMTGTGGMAIDRYQRGKFKERIKDILGERFSRGSLVVFEPTDTGAPASKGTVSASDRLIIDIIAQARAWRYETLIIDFTEHRSNDELKERSLRVSGRPAYGLPPVDPAKSQAHFRRRVGFDDIEALEWADPVDLKDRVLDHIEPKEIDISHFQNVVAIGDIHGCFETLQKLLGDGGPRDDVAYVFLGDYINKGPRSSKVLSYLMDTFEGRANAFFLAGNHERALEDWVNSAPIQKKVFASTTLPDFEANKFRRKDAKRFLSMLLDAARFKWDGLTILATHGGFSRPPSRLAVLSAEHLQHGAENSIFDVDTAWEAGVIIGATPSSSEIIQIHGHRNGHFHPVCAGAGSFNLEGGVDAGGCMRAVVLSKLDAGGYKVSSLEVPNIESAVVKSSYEKTEGEARAFRDTSLPDIMTSS